ncbi:hypothetical protein ACOSQ2_003763 [Xanthoceras sorbifolium]
MSHISESSKAPQGKRRSRPLIVHPQFAERLKKAEKRPIQLKCCIDIDALDGTGILEVVRARQLERFVQHPNDASDKLVRKFYASMVLDDFFAWGTILVQGRQITLTPQIVNEYYELPNLPQAPGEMEVHQFFTIHNPNLAESLRMDWDRYWSNSNNYDLFHTYLHLQSAFKHVFCDHSVLPKTHRTTLTLPVAAVYLSCNKMAGIDRAATGRKTLVPKVSLDRAIYNKLANAWHAPGLSRRRVRQKVDQHHDGYKRDKDQKPAPKD